MTTTPSWFDGFATQRITTSGAEIFVRTGGTVGAPPLLLLHGFPQTHALWHRVVQQLARDYCLVLPDLRGYGDSSHAPGLPDHSNYSKRALAQDMAEVMTTLGHDTFYLCGHDRGGRVAHRLALDAALDSVMDRCVKIEHARLFGGLHWAGVNTRVISAKRAQ